MARYLFGHDNSIVNRCSTAYWAGGITDLVASGVLKGVSGLLRKLASGGKQFKAAARRAARKETYKYFSGGRYGWEVHHKNTLFGFPDFSQSIFPTGGLPAWVNSHRWNLMRVSTTKGRITGLSQHDILGLRARYAERILGAATHPGAILLRTGVLSARGAFKCNREDTR